MYACILELKNFIPPPWYEEGEKIEKEMFSVTVTDKMHDHWL